MSNPSDSPQTPLALSAHFHRDILDLLPLQICVYAVISRTECRVVFLNRSALGGDTSADSAVIGKLPEEFLSPETATQVMDEIGQCLDTGMLHRSEAAYELDTGTLWASSLYAPLLDKNGHVTHVLTAWEDITARKERERAEQQQQAQIIARQAAVLDVLSTPLLTISETTVVMPLIGEIDARRAQQILEHLASGVVTHSASVVILDITGVPVVDTHVAHALLSASQAVKLLGAQIVLTGIRPEVAQTLVGLGVDLGSIITRSTLRDGITYALLQ